MTCTKLATSSTKLMACIVKNSRFLALVVIAAFACAALQPAHAQSSDTWKSVAIIGGSTAAGAYIGHKIAGPTGTLVGAGVGATIGYEVDQRRRANEYYSDNGYYGDNGPYDGNGGYYGEPYDNGGSYDNGSYRYSSGSRNNRSCRQGNQYSRQH